MARKVRVAGRWIGEGESTFIIAEAGVNHNGDISLAKRLIEAAAEAGADAVKFQTFRAENVVTRGAPKAEYQRGTMDTAESQLEMLKKLELTGQDFAGLKDYCEQRGILFMSTPHDQESIDLLEQLGVSLFKVGSGDITNIPYLQHMARKGKPIILSTGMTTLGEVEEAVETILAAGNKDLILLHCVSNYPARVEDCNLRAIQTLEIAFQLPVGFSDHTLGIEISLAAVALGAKVIEKHFTLDKTLPGPDHRVSLEPAELARLVRGIRNIERAIGNGLKRPRQGEMENRSLTRKSLVAACKIPAGTLILDQMIKVKRPGTGLAPKFRAEVVGRRARVDISEDQLIEWRMLDE